MVELLVCAENIIGLSWHACNKYNPAKNMSYSMIIGFT